MILVEGHRERGISGEDEFCVSFTPVSVKMLDD